jgi:CO/xanthine dehydrogenase Mo-binding subunit
MLVAVVAHAPRFGATVKSFDADDAKKVAGVVDVYEIPTGSRWSPTPPSPPAWAARR